MKYFEQLPLDTFIRLSAEQPEYADYYAYRAVRRYMKLQLAIPAVLVPYVEDAFNARMRATQSKIPEKKTKDKWKSLVFDVRMLMHQGYGRDAAVEIIADSVFVEFTSLLSKYKGTRYKNIKEEADLIFGPNSNDGDVFDLETFSD